MARNMPRAAIVIANTAAFLAPESFKARAGSAFVTPRAKKQTERGREFLETLREDTFEGPLGKQRVYAGGDGPLLMFQHGWEADSADLATHAEALTGRGYRVALIDEGRIVEEVTTQRLREDESLRQRYLGV